MNKQPFDANSTEEQVGQFTMILRVIKNNSGAMQINMQSQNQNIPEELLLTQLRFFTKKLEEDLYDKFKGNSVKMDKTLDK